MKVITISFPALCFSRLSNVYEYGEYALRKEARVFAVKHRLSDLIFIMLATTSERFISPPFPTLKPLGVIDS